MSITQRQMDFNMNTGEIDLVANLNLAQKISLMQDPNTSTEILEIFATDDWRVRCQVSDNLRLPQHCLVTLATDSCWNVRYFATQNPNATELVLRLYLMTEQELSTST